MKKVRDREKRGIYMHENAERVNELQKEEKVNRGGNERRNEGREGR